MTFPRQRPPALYGSSADEHSTGWTRRDWLAVTAVQTGALAALAPWRSTASGKLRSSVNRSSNVSSDESSKARAAAHAELLDPGQSQQLAQQAVDAARSAGAQYADARLTRVVQQKYSLGFPPPTNEVHNARLLNTTGREPEMIGVGVRAMVNGYWGFSAFPLWGGIPGGTDAVVRLARDAVAQAKINSKGPMRAVEMGSVPVVKGVWSTPIKIDPFKVTIEEKMDTMAYWQYRAREIGMDFHKKRISYLNFARQERVVATSDGSLFTQILYESDCRILMWDDGKLLDDEVNAVKGLGIAAKGWEMLLEAGIPEQYPVIRAAQNAEDMTSKPAQIGRYTLVCDGATMSSVVAKTLGTATQLDRALGYEANAGGTSFIDDPLAMVGHYQVAAQPVTVTANRSAIAQLATVKWDDEGVEPEQFTLVKDGVLTDFQTTREQAAWLAPYYRQNGHPVRSHGCAGAENALKITMQMMPNLSMEPSHEAVGLNDLVSSVKDGILIEKCYVQSVDFQGRNGLLSGEVQYVGKMREIKNGKIGRRLRDGAVQFNTLDFWKHVLAVGGSSTTDITSESQYDIRNFTISLGINVDGALKGQPQQGTSYSSSAAAAMIANQAIINPRRKA
jgi:TldD protein